MKLDAENFSIWIGDRRDDVAACRDRVESVSDFCDWIAVRQKNILTFWKLLESEL